MVPSFGKKSGSRFTGASKQKYGSLKDDETGLRVDEDERYSGEVSTEEGGVVSRRPRIAYTNKGHARRNICR